MTTQPDLRVSPKLGLFVSFCSVFSIAVGLVGLAGWVFQIEILKTVLPGLVAIKANTAVCFVLIGFSLWWQGIHKGHSRSISSWIARAAAAVVGVVGLLSFLEFLVGRNFGIDQLLFVETAGGAIGSVRPGLMSPITAIAFILLGLALLLLDWTRRSEASPAQYLAFGAGLISLFTFLDFIVQPHGSHAGIALHTAIALCMLSLGVMCSRPERGFVGALLNSNLRSGTLRALWAAAISDDGPVWRRPLRHGLAVLLVFLATVLSHIPDGLLPERLPYITYYPATMIAALVGGLGPGIVATLLSGVCIDYFFLEPTGQFGNKGLPDLIGLIIFTLIGISMSWLSGAVNRTRKQAADETRRAKEEWERTFDSVPEAVMVLDPEFRIQRANRAMTELLALQPGAVLGKHCFELVHNRTSPVTDCPLRQMLESGKQEQREVVESRLNKIFDVSATPLWEGKTLRGCVHVIRDITERKQTEAALQDSETKFRTLSELAPQIVWACTPDGLNIYFNQRWVEYTGLTLEESYGRGWNTPFHPDDKQAAWDAWNHAVATGDTYRVESRLQGADGRYRWFLMRGVPLRDSSGTIVKWFGTCTDIDDLKRAERTLGTLSACNDSLVRATDEQSLLQRICDLVVNVGGYHMAWVGNAEDDERKTVRVVAESGFEAGYLDSMNITLADEERGRGPTGTAIRTGQLSVCNDTTTDPFFAPWRENAIKRGYRSTLVLPLMSGKKVLGAISIYATEAWAFDAAEQHLLKELSNNLSYGITSLRERAERKRAEEKLRTAALYSRSLLEASLDPLVTISREGKITDVNEATAKVTGVSRQQLIGSDFSDYFTQPEKARDGYELAFAGGSVQDYPLAIRHVSGNVTDVLYNASVFKNEAGQIEGVFAAARDITQRKRVEEEIRKLNHELEKRVQERTVQLQESERRVRRKLESILSPEGDLGDLDLVDILDITALQSLVDDFYAVAHIPIGIIDLKGKVLAGVGWQDICTKFHRVNPETCKNCLESDTVLSAGAAPGEFKIYKCKNNMWDVATPITVGGQHLGNLFTGQFFFADEPIDHELFRTQARHYGFNEGDYLAAMETAPHLNRDAVNASMAFLAKLARVLSQLGHSGVKLARSLAELNRVNSELTASVKELEAFTYSVSHDLRAPLRHISGFSKILTEEFGSNLPPEAQHSLQRIEEGTRRMGLLVDDLLNLARIGRRDLSLQVSGLKSIMDEVITELAPECAGRQIVWRIADLPFVACDRGLMKQVFQNLLSNALKFSRPRSPAVIEVGQNVQAGTTVVFVRDNGVGFNIKYADKLFGVFQRLHRVEDFEGTGVGLATVQRIIQKHGGRIWAEAELDKGATFFFTLGTSEKTELKTNAVTVGDKA